MCPSSSGRPLAPQDYGGAVVVGDDVRATFTGCSFTGNGRALCADQGETLVRLPPEAPSSTRVSGTCCRRGIAARTRGWWQM